jgi:hypothetical protein
MTLQCTKIFVNFSGEKEAKFLRTLTGTKASIDPR